MHPLIAALEKNNIRESKPPSCTIQHHLTASEPFDLSLFSSSSSLLGCPFAFGTGSFTCFLGSLGQHSLSFSHMLSWLSNNRGVHSHVKTPRQSDVSMGNAGDDDDDDDDRLS